MKRARGHRLWALAFAAGAAACTPSYAHLLESRRYADAMCLASSPAEAEALVRAVERDAAPRLNLYPVHAQELAPLLGDRAGEVSKQLVLLRAKTAHDTLSIAALDTDVHLRQRKRGALDTGDDDPVIALSSSAHDRMKLFALTGEKPPSSYTTVDGEALVAAIFTIGLSRLFSSRPLWRDVEPTDEQFVAAGPKADALLRALTGGRSAQGYAILTEDPPKDVQVGVTLDASDYLNDGGPCELRVSYTLDLPSVRPAAAPFFDGMFGTRMRYVRDLPVRSRTYSVSNPSGNWHGP